MSSRTTTALPVPGVPARWPGVALRGAGLAVLIGLALYPIIFMILTSLKTPIQVDNNYFTPELSSEAAENYRRAADIVVPLIWNSVRASLVSLAITLFMAVTGAYVLTWQRFRGRELIYTILIATMIIPVILIFIPEYILVRDLGLLDSYWALVLPYVAQTVGFTIFLLRAFFGAVPTELIEAARLDGAGELRVLTRIVLPLTVPVLVTVSVVNILVTWNQFLWPLVTISSASGRTVPVGLSFLQSQFTSNLPTLMAGYALASIPLLVLFAVTMKYFLRGFAAGAVRG